MGASSPVIVTILRLVEEEIEVFAVHLDEAEREAANLDDTFRVIGSRWKGYDED